MRPGEMLCATVTAVWLAAAGTTAWGQVQLTPTSYMGKIVGVNGLEIYVKANNGVSIIASLDPKRQIKGATVPPGQIADPHIEVNGQISTANLGKGMYVRFPATLARGVRRTTVEPVTELQVFSPAAGTQFGLLSEALGADGPQGDNADNPEKCLVVGVISGIRGDALTVEFPGGNTKGSVIAKVDPNAVVNVKLNVLFAPPGADITVEGVQVLGEEVQPIKVLATNVQVQLPPPPPPQTKLARRPGEGEGKNSPDRADPFAPAEVEKSAEPKKRVPGKILKIN